MNKLFIALVLGILSFPSYAIVITHGSSGGAFTQNNGASNTNFANFDRAQFTFASVFADTITIANTGTAAFAHNHGQSRYAEVDVFNGTNWINVFSQAIPGSITLSSLFSSAITFTGMSISGLRLDVDAPVNQAYHSVSSGMTYTTSGTPVPEPMSLALLGLGLAGIGIRRKVINK